MRSKYFAYFCHGTLFDHQDRQEEDDDDDDVDKQTVSSLTPGPIRSLSVFLR